MDKVSKRNYLQFFNEQQQQNFTRITSVIKFLREEKNVKLNSVQAYNFLKRYYIYKTNQIIQEKKKQKEEERRLYEERAKKAQKRKENRQKQREERIKKAMRKPENLKIYNSTSEKNVKFNLGKLGLLNDITIVKIKRIYLDIPFTTNELITMKKIFLRLYNDMPDNGKFCISVSGFLFKGDEKKYTKERTIFKSFVSSNFDEQFNNLSLSSRLNMPSEYYYITDYFDLYYFNNNGGNEKEQFKLNGYRVFSNKNNDDNCGHYILKLLNIEAPKGIINESEMKVLVDGKYPILNNINCILPEKFILLNNNHWLLCVKKWTEENKKNRKLKRQEIRKQIKNNKENILIWDIESKKMNDGEQIPVLIGCFDGENYKDFEGELCIINFIKYALNYDFLIGYNSNSYDYILIKKELNKMNISLKEIKRSTNNILHSSILKQEGGEIHFIDLLNFTNGTLRDNLNKYGCETLKGEIDYKLIGYDTSEQFIKLLKEYCKSDVIGTYQLFNKLNEPYILRNLNILKLYTLSQGAYKIMKDTLKKYDITEKIVRDKDNFFREAIHGGRCEVFKREYVSSQYNNLDDLEYDEINDFMRGLDVNSLYPHAMSKNKYPVGNSYLTSDYKKGLLGIYKCKIIKPKNLIYPVSYDRERQSYDLLDSEGIYTSIDIEQMIKYNYKIDVEFGYYWKNSDYIFQDYINEFYEIKKNSEKGTPIYENAKLMLNSTYGKTIQRDNNEVEYICYNDRQIKDVIELVAKENKQLKNENLMTGLNMCIEDNYIIMSYSPPLPIYTTKKSWLGAFILSYSKITVYDLMNDTEPYYTDTDCLFVENNKSKYFNIGDELGQYSDDYNGKIIKAIFTAKKLKIVEILTNDENLIKKLGSSIVRRTKAGAIYYKITGKGCNVKDLKINDFERMLNNEIIINTGLNFKKNLKKGTIKTNDLIKKIKMNDGKRRFKNNISYPLGYEATICENLAI
jgi:hypothetical protein